MPRRLRVLLCAAVVVVIAAIVIPSLLTVCSCGNNDEASAIGALRAINSAQSAYSPACAGPVPGYAVDLADLAKPPAGSTQGFVSPDLPRNGVVRTHYTIVIEKDRAPGVVNVGSAAATCNASTGQPVSSYFASAVPVTPGPGMSRYFATDSRGTIYQSTSGPIPNPIPGDAQPVQ